MTVFTQRRERDRGAGVGLCSQDQQMSPVARFAREMEMSRKVQQIANRIEVGVKPTVLLASPLAIWEEHQAELRSEEFFARLTARGEHTIGDRVARAR